MIAGMMEVLDPREQIERVRYNEVMGFGEVMERSNACVEVFRGGSVTVSGNDVVESDNWAKVVLHIVNASSKKAERNSGRRGEFRYRFPGDRPRLSSLLDGSIISYVFQLIS
jgi:hypothetical protein